VRVLIAGKALASSAVHVRKSTVIVFITPRHRAGSVRVRVRTLSGLSGRAHYRFLVRPLLHRLPAVCGHTSGGQLLTLHGARTTCAVTQPCGSPACARRRSSS
jgi:hypothetical protein